MYWKPIDVFPGCKAFLKYGSRNPRIEVAALKKSMGALPTQSTDQNSMGYKLYKQVPNEPEGQ